jgi:hypothetical protein
MRYLAEALTLRPARPLFSELRSKLDELHARSLEDGGTLAGMDLRRCAEEVDELLLRVSGRVRAAGRGRARRDRPGSKAPHARSSRDLP